MNPIFHIFPTERYPLVICYITMDNYHRNIGFTHSKHGDFPISFLYVYQRLFPSFGVLGNFSPKKLADPAGANCEFIIPKDG
jgi:hypothetical protein